MINFVFNKQLLELGYSSGSVVKLADSIRYVDCKNQRVYAINLKGGITLI